MSELKIGDKVRILNVCIFNEGFVKVGDIAEVIEINTFYIEIKSASWEHSQFICNFMENQEWELVGDEL